MSMDLDIAYTDSRNWDTEMPARFKWLRENEPVYWSEKDDLWVISSYEHVSNASKRQDLFTSAKGVRPGNPVMIGLIDEDEPRHGELRKLINKGFTPRMVKKLEITFRELTTRAIDAIAKDGQCDFVESISVPLPLWIIAAMLGIPEEDYGKFHHWSDSMIAADGNMGDLEILAKAGKAFAEYAAYITPIIEDRRKNPQDDLMSILTGAKDAGLLKTFEQTETIEALNEATEFERDTNLHNDELIKLMVILLVAGNETTRNGISGGMELLIRNPGERQKLIDDPSLIPMAVEEMLRMVSPVNSFSRTCLEDTELDGKKILKNQQILMIYPSANRDAAVFEDPDEFRIDRNPAHVGFGVGSHFCLGANLARMEMRVTFQELLRRLPDMEFTEGGPELPPSAIVRTCTVMKVKYTPEA